MISSRSRKILQMTMKLKEVGHDSYQGNTHEATPKRKDLPKNFSNVDTQSSRNITPNQKVHEWIANNNFNECSPSGQDHNLKAVEPNGIPDEQDLKFLNSDEKKKYLDISPIPAATDNCSYAGYDEDVKEEKSDMDFPIFREEEPATDRVDVIKILYDETILFPDQRTDLIGEKSSANIYGFHSECSEDIEGANHYSYRQEKSKLVKHSVPKKTLFETEQYSMNDICESICDDDRDKDFILSDLSNLSSSSDESLTNMVIEEPNDLPSLAENIKENKIQKEKLIRCKYCDEDVTTKNFSRHIERKHSSESEVIKILKLPKNSRERRNAFMLLRNDTNFNLYINGTTRPNRHIKTQKENHELYYPCAYCKGLYIKRYLSRHAKRCIVKVENNTRNFCSASQTLTACAMDTSNVISKLNVKHQVFDLMKPDDISLEAKKDLLIVHFGESYLKKHKRERMHYTCSSRMRELSRLLIEFRNISGEDRSFLKDLIVPRKFGMVLSSVREITGYDPVLKTYRTPSLAMHLGTSLKHACYELKNLILQESEGFRCSSNISRREWIEQINDFIKLIESRWTIELASLANKDLQEKKWNKPLLIPLVEDIKKFKDQSLKLAEKCMEDFSNNIDQKSTYTNLVHCSLALLILFNRRRIGDVQFLKIKDYKCDRKTDFVDFQSALTESEKLLTKQYRRVVNSGKGSRAVVILIPRIIQRFIDLLLERREKYIPRENEYIFAMPGSTIKWGKGDVSFRTLTKKMNLKHPEAIGSNKLRKHIATVMQILNLSKEETKQFSNFMGHTEKTHEEFYELPVDIYQTAKVSKILLMMDRGSLPAEFKGKSLSEINVDIDSTFVEENNVEDLGPMMNVDNLSSNTLDGNDCTISKKRKASQETSNTFQEAGGSNEATEDTYQREKICKKGWTEEDVQLLLREFGKHISKRVYPSGAEIQQMLERTKMQRTKKVVKSKLQHLMKKM